MNKGIRSTVYLTVRTRSRLRLKSLSLSKAVTELINRYTIIINPIKAEIIEMFSEDDWKEILFYADRDWEAEMIVREFGKMLNDMIKPEIFNKLKHFTKMQIFAFVEVVEWKLDSRMPAKSNYNNVI